MNAATTYNLLFKTEKSGYFVKAGQQVIADKPQRGMEIDIEVEGRKVRAVIEHIYVPPGCDEHCIGNLFVRAC